VLAKESGETSIKANVLEGVRYRVTKKHAANIQEVRLNLAGAREKVDFAIIDRKQKLHLETLAADVSTVVARTVKQLLGSDEDLTKLLDDDTSDIANLDVPGVARGRIKGAFKNALSSAWTLGRQLAKEELTRTQKKFKASDQAHFASLRDKAADYFENNGFRMAGNVSDGVRALMQNELQTAVKYGKSPKQVRESIWDRLTAKGFVSRDSVRDVEDNDGVIQALDELWVDTEAEAAHYLDTLARTNLFEAMNEARYGEFTDPALEGFVVAFRYSAILDDRTTEVCRELHDSVYEADSELWNEYRPPNHFNCRSILIPVTQVDVQNGEWNGEESDAPEVEPQEGFK
jgi:SPP1 gp7 family putative phage head morphogenesis protein